MILIGELENQSCVLKVYFSRVNLFQTRQARIYLTKRYQLLDFGVRWRSF